MYAQEPPGAEMDAGEGSRVRQRALNGSIRLEYTIGTTVAAQRGLRPTEN